LTGQAPYKPAPAQAGVLVLQTLYTLSDDQTEYQLKDRLSLMRFVGLALHDAVAGRSARRTTRLDLIVQHLSIALGAD
jgi:IS5 family transposase